MGFTGCQWSLVQSAHTSKILPQLCAACITALEQEGLPIGNQCDVKVVYHRAGPHMMQDAHILEQYLGCQKHVSQCRLGGSPTTLREVSDAWVPALWCMWASSSHGWQVAFTRRSPQLC